MKKTLIALAAVAATSAAFAQSSVTLYGTADMWLGSTKDKASGGGSSESLRQSKVDSGGVSTSKFGFKGSEDLGGGLKANFQLEQGINVDTGAAQESGLAFNRQAWVGLSGGFGEVQVGKVWTSYDDIRASANDTFNANVASSISTWLGYSDRTDNGIKYTSPSFAGFSGSLTYEFGEDKTTTTSASSVTSLGVNYAQGPLFVGFAHQQQKAKSNGKFSAVPGFVSAEDIDFDDFDADVKTTYNLINASYDLGVAKLVGGYNQVKITEGSVDGSVKAKEYNLGVEVPLASNLNLGVGYAESKVKADGESIFKTKGYSAAVVYSLSKRTSLYAAATQTKLTSSDGDGSIKSNLYAVGVNHSF